MITLKVTTFNGQPMSLPLSADFDEMGGTIGRAEGNTLVLLDLERHISRTHASIEFRGGKYIICDHGSIAPIYLNGQPLGKGREAPIADGDELTIGGYALKVLDGGLQAAPTILAAPGVIPGGVFAEESPLLPQAESEGRVAPPEQGADMLPPDYDPLAELATVSIDKLFGLSADANLELLGPGNLVTEPISETLPDSQSVQRDDVPDLHDEFQPPAAEPDKLLQNIVPVEPTPGMTLSRETDEAIEGTGGIQTLVVPSPMREEEEQGRAATTAISAEDKPPPVEMGSVSKNELLLAFLAGAGVPELDIGGELTPEMMHTFGQLLRDATQGTLDLLLARALIKREVRADLTIIMSKENNPLKFSPNVEVALSHLLAPRGRGFLSPTGAMKDAYDDLRSHQFGFMAGMRAALAGVLERFDPDQLERRLMQKTLFDSLLPKNRKAKLWDLFSELYADLSKEAEDDFYALFGKEFLRAYDEQVAKLEQRNQEAKP